MIRTGAADTGTVRHKAVGLHGDEAACRLMSLHDVKEIRKKDLDRLCGVCFPQGAEARTRKRRTAENSKCQPRPRRIGT